MKISLSAGHGYNTAGKRIPDESMREWEFNARVATLIQEELNNYENIQTLRLDDVTGKTDPSLSSRANKANSWGADVHIDIHANAFGAGGFNTVGGIETFVYSSRPKDAVSLSAYVQNHLIRDTGLTNRGIKAANFQMLRDTNMTAILVECGFMTNKEEAALLKSEIYRKKCALAIVKGLVDQYKMKKKPVKELVIASNTDEPSAWAKGAWEKAVVSEITDGTDPKEPLTREQLMVVLDRLGLLK